MVACKWVRLVPLTFGILKAYKKCQHTLSPNGHWFILQITLTSQLQFKVVYRHTSGPSVSNNVYYCQTMVIFGYFLFLIRLFILCLPNNYSTYSGILYIIFWLIMSDRLGSFCFNCPSKSPPLRCLINFLNCLGLDWHKPIL